MKRIIFLIMFWNILFGNMAQDQDWANKARYACANNELLAHGNQPVKVVMMGNSITEFWEELHPQFFKDNGLVGRGIGGQVSSQMLARFRQDVINLHPLIVVINCGTNDIAENNGPYDEDITMDNIESMTELAKAHGIQVVLSSVLPTDRFSWNPRVKDVALKIRNLNQRIIEYCDSNHIPYIDYYRSMTTDAVSMIAGYTDDGVHPNSAGYDIMELKLMAMLETLEIYNNNK
ncbi:MAG: hypothetical protein IJM58_01285 [Muribaculaceae bacterium]|nr:hypothetical protein [Muribaculaceae bacterium]